MPTYRQFAERILFSDQLSEKLATPTTTLTDDSPGPAFPAPASPTRPAELRFANPGQRAARPSAHQLTDDRQRGLLLHFFCNHELLATELMALALMKFPEAPAAFRRGLLRTLQEEQQHTAWYLQRMAECGVSFGEYPVNGFFWQHIADMPTPLDYVARLSLTFEQANLDYAQHFSARFAEAGDAITAALLQRIYHDEIAHVGYGLKWFRHWKGPHQSDWQAYQEILPFPLSPARAKGTVHFNAPGRRKAGLDDDFISQLQLYSQSRGRPPSIYLFNPQAEATAAALDPLAVDPTTRQLATDLDTLSLFLARAEDTALLQRVPRPEFLHYLQSLGAELPAQEILAHGQLSPTSPLRQRKLGRLRPWGWSPDSHALLADLLPQLTAEPTLSPWSEATRPLYSKTHAAALLRQLPWEPAFGSPDIIGSLTRSLEEIWSTGHDALLKADFGLAGRNHLRLPANTPPSAIPDPYSIREPWLHRLADFSIQYEIDPGHAPRFKTLIRLHCSPGGRFTACSATQHFSRLLPAEIARFLHEQGPRWLPRLYEETIPALLATALAPTPFRGPLGIDAFFYREATGAIRLKPIVEINPRFTMGRLTHELLRLAAPGHTVLLRIFTQKMLKAARYLDFPTAAAALFQKHPLERTAHRINTGAITLNDPTTAHTFLAAALFCRHPLKPEDFTL